MITRCVLMVLAVVVLLMKIKGSITSSLGSYSSYVEDSISMPYFKCILLAVILTIGADFLWALFLKLFTAAFGGRVTFSGMVSVVGCTDMFHCLITAVSIVLLLISYYAGLIVFVAGSVWPMYLEMCAYFTYADMSNDRKAYAYMVSKLIFGLVFSVITGILAGTLVEGLVSMMK